VSKRFTVVMSDTRSINRPELIDHVFQLRHVLKRLFGAGMYKELRDELHSVTIHQLSTLGHLKAGPLSMRELARVLDVSESSVTAVTDRLVRQGLVERQSDASDRRIVRLALSEQGRTLVTRLDEAAAEKATEMLSVLSDEQLASMADILDTLSTTLPDNICSPVHLNERDGK
jgi:DNA-binding MarR family transcriptional regulator